MKGDPSEAMEVTEKTRMMFEQEHGLFVMKGPGERSRTKTDNVR